MSALPLYTMLENMLADILKRHAVAEVDIERLLVFTIGGYYNCLVFGDSGCLLEVFQNIIENAIKYGNGKKIWLDIIREEEECVIAVENTG